MRCGTSGNIQETRVLNVSCGLFYPILLAWHHTVFLSKQHCAKFAFECPPPAVLIVFPVMGHLALPRKLPTGRSCPAPHSLRPAVNTQGVDRSSGGRPAGLLLAFQETQGTEPPNLAIFSTTAGLVTVIF